MTCPDDPTITSPLLHPPRREHRPFRTVDQAIRWSLRSPLDAHALPIGEPGGGFNPYGRDLAIDMYSRIKAALGRLSLFERWLVTRYAELGQDPEAHLEDVPGTGRARLRGSYRTLEGECRSDGVGMRTSTLRARHKAARDRVARRLADLGIVDDPPPESAESRGFFRRG